METKVFTAGQYYAGLITLSLLNRAAFERFTESTWLAFDEDYQGPASDEEAVEYIAELHTQACSTLARTGYATKFESNQLRLALKENGHYDRVPSTYC